MTQSELMIAGATTTHMKAGARGGNSMAPAANSSAANVVFGTQGIVRNASGTHVLFANVAIKIITTTGSSTLTNSASLWIEGSGTGGTNNYAMWVAAGISKFDGVIRTAAYTVATLPTGAAGDTAYVTDATALSYGNALTGGGAVRARVFHNGTAWVNQ